jgi:hypothetical protein
MVDRIKSVLGAFAENDGSYRIMQLPIARCIAIMEPTRNTGPSRDRVGMYLEKCLQMKEAGRNSGR